MSELCQPLQILNNCTIYETQKYRNCVRIYSSSYLNMNISVYKFYGVSTNINKDSAHLASYLEKINIK